MKTELVIPTESTEETKELGKFIGGHAEDDLFIALIGDLGAGKTHFVQGLAEGLDITDPVTSPTFNLMNIYDGRLQLKHFDFYRLEDEEDLYNIGWDEYSVGGVTVCEWADMFPGLIPREAVTVKILKTGETTREIHISWNEKAPANLVKEIQNYATCH